MNLIQILARLKARQTRGGSWMQFILNFGIITANIALFQDFFEQYGIGLSTMLILGIAGYLLGTMTIGFLDERYGIWKCENEYNSSLNPITMKMLGHLDRLSMGGKERD